MATLTNLTNKQIIEAIVSKYPNIAGQSSKLAYELLTEAGYAQLSQFNKEFVNEFFGLLVRVWLQEVNISHAKDPLEENGFGEYYDQPYGGITQRMSVDSVKGVSPGWKNLANGSSPDPFVVRKPIVNERFYPQNFDYASLITIPDSFAFKQAFVSNYGIDELMGGIMEGMENGYTLQKYTMKIDCINAAINDTVVPLQSTQQYLTSLSDSPTAAELLNFLETVSNVVETMVYAPQTGAFNSAGFASTQDKSRLKLLVRMGLSNAIKFKVLYNSYHIDKLDLDVDIIPVPNFGGMQPFTSSAFTTALYPVYDSLGTQIGWNTTEGKIGEDNVQYKNSEVYWKDPNERVIAVLADKGVIFESVQNPYSVEPMRNPRGLYTNYWASSPNNAMNYDRYYNMVVFYSSLAPDDDEDEEQQ